MYIWEIKLLLVTAFASIFCQKLSFRLFMVSLAVQKLVNLISSGLVLLGRLPFLETAALFCSYLVSCSSVLPRMESRICLLLLFPAPARTVPACSRDSQCCLSEQVNLVMFSEIGFLCHCVFFL